MKIVRQIVRFLVSVAVVIYTLLDELVFPLVRPLIAWLTRLQLFQKLGALIGRLPPYLVLLLLAVPFVIIEPAKLVAVYIAATGHVVLGTVMLLVAEALSILICERIYHAGYAPLMRIGWFARLMAWLVRLRDRAFALVRATPAWRAAVTLARSLRAWLRGVIAGLR